MMIRREILDEIGLLDERFTPGNYEDDDLSYRILKSKHELILCLDSYIHHFGGTSFMSSGNDAEMQFMSYKYIDLCKNNDKISGLRNLNKILKSLILLKYFIT